MACAANPYRPPRWEDEDGGVWWRLQNLFASVVRFAGPKWGGPKFSHGDAVICQGIAFFIDPAQPGLLFATTPSVQTNDRRLEFIRAEVEQVLPNFQKDFPELCPVIAGRRVVVGIIERYTETKKTMVRQAQTDMVIPSLTPDTF